ncbi:MAG: hypothetical protein QOF39_885 [Frankiales bacterium]|nr:hypothetical protein [Frankiales bacterium]
MNIVTYCSVLLIVIGLYATVRAATGSRLGALTAAGLLLGTPSVWAQMVVLGLYPRFAALAPMALALAAAVAHSRRGGRLRGAATCLLLAAALSIHPIVGVIGVGLIGAVYVLDPRRPVVTRLVSGTAVLAAAFGLSAYFYLPLALSKRSQSAFTDTEVSLSWHMLYSHGPRSLDGLTPVLLGLGLLLVCYAARALLPPTVPFAEKVALGRDVIFLSTLDEQTPVPASAGPATRRFARWFAVLRQRVAADRPAGLPGVPALRRRRPGGATSPEQPGRCRLAAPGAAGRRCGGRCRGHRPVHRGYVRSAQPGRGDERRGSATGIGAAGRGGRPVPVPLRRRRGLHQLVGQRVLPGAADPRLRRPRRAAPGLAGLARGRLAAQGGPGAPARLHARLVRRQVG